MNNAQATHHQTEKDIIESLNETIHDMISEPAVAFPEPLMLPDPLPSSPALPSLPVTERRETSVAPSQDDGDIRDWLTRPAEEQPEKRSLTSILTLCLGTMFLSILAGYGSAQLLNRSFDDATSGGDNLMTAASNAALSLPWPSDSSAESESAKDKLDVDGQAQHMRVVPANRQPAGEPAVPKAEHDLPTVADQTAMQLVERERATDTESVKFEPVKKVKDTARLSLAGLADVRLPELQDAVESSSSSTKLPDRKTVTPKLSPESVPNGAISKEETEHLLRRAKQLISDGDIAAARLMLRHLAEAGNGPAALKLAQAYDPDWLAANSAGSIPANRDLAIRWYTMAHERGQDGAAARVDALEAAQ